MGAFSNIIGYKDIKEQFYQVIDIFKNEDVYKNMGAFIPSGILIVGDPGLGKTTLAKTFIEECGVESFVIKNNQENSDLLISQIKDTFLKGSKFKKSIILFDDIDKFTNSKETNVFSCIQACIDDFKNKGVLVIATANDDRYLPSSLVRKGRFDRHIYIGEPSEEDAFKIVEFYLKGKKVDKNLNFEDVNKMIVYKSCAELETIINESANYAAYKRKDAIDIDDIVKGYNESLNDNCEVNLLDKASKETVNEICIHEAGHVVVSLALKQNSVGFVYLNKTLDGYTQLCENFNRRCEQVMIYLGGKVASELYLNGRCASGCQSDLSKAISLIKSGISENGTCGIGCLDTSIRREAISNYLSSKIENAIQVELEKYLYQVRAILIKNRELVFLVASSLQDKGYLLYSDMKKILDKVNVVPYFCN